jgi:fermentation-respiration switch protein FrsA (DUF1100 family)
VDVLSSAEGDASYADRVPAPGRRPLSFWRPAARVLGVVAFLYVLLVAAAALFYRRLLYPAPRQFPAGVPPSARLLEAPTADGAHVRALLYDGPKTAPIVVHFHGNGETMGHDVWVAEELHRRGLAVALVEYRGYGLSRGEPPPTEDGLYADAAAALDALEAAGYGRERVVLWGQSLGSGVAAEMAVRGRAGAVVLVCPYTSIVDMARRLTPPGLPIERIVRDRYDTLAKAPRITIPALVVHGDEDELIPHAMGERVAKALPHATFYTVRGGHHGDLVAVDAAGVFAAVAKLAHDLAPRPPGDGRLAPGATTPRAAASTAL